MLFGRCHLCCQRGNGGGVKEVVGVADGSGKLGVSAGLAAHEEGGQPHHSQVGEGHLLIAQAAGKVEVGDAGQLFPGEVGLPEIR